MMVICSYNLITAMFYSYCLFITTVGLFVNSNFASVNVISDFYKYGKLSRKKTKWILKFMEVPKRWFLHFYFTSFLMCVASWILIWYVNVKGNDIPYYIDNLLSCLTTPERETAVNLHVSYLALFIYSAHVGKRLLESLYVSVFSDSKMNVGIYIVGHTHYIGAFIGLLSQFPGLSSSGLSEKAFQLSVGLSWYHFVAVLFVIGASVIQFHSLKILANLRRNNDVHSKKKYLVPSGGLFTYVSCPHMLMEITVYFGLCALMDFRHSTWNITCLFVICNQIQIAISNHKWYKKQFKDYPLSRKAIIPFIL